MKRLTFAALIIPALFGCKKNTFVPENIKPQPFQVTNANTSVYTDLNAPAPTGKYELFRVCDTSFAYDGDKIFSRNVSHQTRTGDTSYVDIESPDVFIDINKNYTPTIVVQDSLQFTSSAQGLYLKRGQSFSFNYDVKTASFDDGLVNERIRRYFLVPNSTMVAIRETVLLNTQIAYAKVYYYKKVQ